MADIKISGMTEEIDPADSVIVWTQDSGGTIDRKVQLINVVTKILNGATLTAATVAGTDKILGQDADDSDNLKTFTAQSIADLASGGSSWISRDRTGGDNSGAAGWDFAIDGTTATPITFTGLGTYQDFIVLARGITKSISGSLILQVSDDNGVSYYTSSGNYVSINSNGIESSETVFVAGGVDATAARNLFAHVPGGGVTGTIKWVQAITGSTPNRAFVASTSPINALQVSSQNGGNFTGGKIWVMTR